MTGGGVPLCRGTTEQVLGQEQTAGNSKQGSGLRSVDAAEVGYGLKIIAVQSVYGPSRRDGHPVQEKKRDRSSITRGGR